MQKNINNPSNIALLIYEGEIEINAEKHSVSKLKISSVQKERPLFSFGESRPFAVISDKAKYTVDIEGIDTDSLSDLQSFEVALGDRDVIFNGCVWTKILPEERKMSFVSYEKREGNDIREGKEAIDE